MNSIKIKKICGLTTQPITIKAFMLANFKYVAEHGWEPYAISQPSEMMTKDVLGPVNFIPVDIKWGNVSPWEVIKTIWKLYKIFRRERFDVIQYATSNAALYSCIAGWMARIPARIYCQWGISYTDYKGIKLWFYKTAEKVTCLFSTSVQPDSKANLQFSIEEGLYSAKKGSVLFNGSACGADMVKYDIKKKEEWAEEIADKYDTQKYRKVFGYVGRVVPEKGINELLEAFMAINDPESLLMIVGPTEEVGRLDQDLYQKSLSQENIIYVGSVPNAAKYFAVFDFMMLPSYREGFGMTVLEAAAMGVPSIISNIKGPTDLIRDGFNGLVCEVKSAESLQKTMQKALQLNEKEYKELGVNAYQEVLEKYDALKFKQAFLDNRTMLLEKSRW